MPTLRAWIHTDDLHRRTGLKIYHGIGRGISEQVTGGADV